MGGCKSDYNSSHKRNFIEIGLLSVVVKTPKNKASFFVLICHVKQRVLMKINLNFEVL